MIAAHAVIALHRALVRYERLRDRHSCVLCAVARNAARGGRGH